MISPGRIRVVAKKELLQLRRDRMTIGMMIMLPIMQLLLFGYAIDTDVRHMPTLVYDADHTPRSRDLVRRLEATGFYDVVGQASAYDDIATAFRSGDARVAIVIPGGFDRDLGRHHPTSVQLVVDGSDAQVVASATNTAATVVASWSAEIRVSVWRQGGPEPITM